MRHRWKKMQGRDVQVCERCSLNRTLCSNARRRMGSPVGKHWEHWRAGGNMTRHAPRCIPAEGQD